MLGLGLGAETPFQGNVLCLGAHSDDVEIGCGGTLLRLADAGQLAAVTWVIFAADPVREREATRSAEVVLRQVPKKDVMVHSFRDGFLPYHGAQIKERFEELKARLSPDLVFTHYRADLHQDHR